MATPNEMQRGAVGSRTYLERTATVSDWGASWGPPSSREGGSCETNNRPADAEWIAEWDIPRPT